MPPGPVKISHKKDGRQRPLDMLLCIDLYSVKKSHATHFYNKKYTVAFRKNNTV